MFETRSTTARKDCYNYHNLSIKNVEKKNMNMITKL